MGYHSLKVSLLPFLRIFLEIIFIHMVVILETLETERKFNRNTQLIFSEDKGKIR